MGYWLDDGNKTLNSSAASLPRPVDTTIFNLRNSTVVASAMIVIASCTSPNQPSILLFNGLGTSRGDVAALERILSSHNFAYVTADSSRLDSMSEVNLRKHRLLIVPGGNFEQMGKGLAPATMANVRKAVWTCPLF